MSADGMIWSAEAALERAVLTGLRADTEVQAVLGHPARIFDDESPEPVFPYAELERHEVAERGSAGVPGQVHTLTFAVRSRDGGRAAAKEVLGALRAASERLSLSLAGQRVVLIQPVYGDVMRARDLRSFRGVLRLRIITEEAV
ncbi:DUF3168 domain-containing protein [Henriciella aquimarina]|uniref:DUF3168 domain-containing protein n=1 Tax=Henriciella aquimarina TaxID=545261 RepID=UPI0009FD5F80|nr:DUF3168 domain-containing protein [Henriciella aquimarina]